MRPISPIRKAKEAKRSLLNFSDELFAKIRILILRFFIHTFRFFCKITFIAKLARKSALDLKLHQYEFSFANLPDSFDGCRLLFMSDFHIDMLEEIEKPLFELIDKAEYDFCLLGGDYSYRSFGKGFMLSKEFEKRLTGKLKSKGKPIYGALGNHDIYDVAELLQDFGVIMLINESAKLEKNGSIIFLSAVDDADYYKSHDLSLCKEGIKESNTFKIIISHTPDIYKEVENHGYNLMLCGHTHGGQICLPHGVPIITNTTAPRKIARGNWEYKKLKGITTTGIGCSTFAGRLFCPPEITIIKLKKT